MGLLPWPIYAVYVLITSLIVLAFGIVAVSKRAKVPGRLQMSIELTMSWLRDVFLDTLGPDGARHLPLAFALFFYILFSNLLGLIPLFKSATSNPSNTVGLGILVFFYTQYVGIRARGFVGYIKHFMGPLLILAPLFLVIEILGELIKPFSLGMRLFGNIYAEDKMNDLAVQAGHHFFLPIQLIVYPLQIFTGVIQAFIFSVLTCAYIGIMAETHHETGDHDPAHPHEETTDEKLTDTLGSMGARA